MKLAILLVAFGSTDRQARKSFDNIQSEISAIYPGTEVRFAFTSNFIRRKLAEQGELYDAPIDALKKIYLEGVTAIVIQPFYVIPGKEYDKLIEQVDEFSLEQDDVKTLVGTPLIKDLDAVNSISEKLLSITPELFDGEGAVFMGHGTVGHNASFIYSELSDILPTRFNNIFLATIEGTPTLDEIMPMLIDLKIKRVYLIPLLAVAGIHVKDDMVSDSPNSWSSILNDKGIETIPILKGLLEYQVVVDVWQEKLADKVKELLN
jgi:sirohydrochlorin cobaltochelatase